MVNLFWQIKPLMANEEVGTYQNVRKTQGEQEDDDPDRE